MSFKKKYLFALISLLLLSLFLVGCNNSEDSSVSASSSIPTINLSYFRNDHQIPLFTAFAESKNFEGMDSYLEPIIEKEKYKLITNGEEKAIIEVIVSQGGAESTTMFAQGNLDIASFSITAAMTGIDSGVPIKVLAPVHTDGPGLVMHNDIDVNGWEEFLQYVQSQDEPVKIGYHSPTSSPKIVFEGALERAGINYTIDPNNTEADILLVDLRSAANFTSSLISGEVDGWVGPSPHPQVAAFQGNGNFVMSHRDLPPDGFWHGFPCCVIVTSDRMLQEEREIVSTIMKLVTYGADYIIKNPEIGASVSSDWLGIPIEAARNTNVVYTTEPSENFLRGANTYLEVLNDIGNFNDKLKGKNIEEAKDLLFDFSIIEEILN
ncbi:NitT/TauT family transport system substrate-binding protein [Natronincola peptidivorans]|uniref:NitT/TauT family transport system substrate-binding protein n=1 Tax=Natronincola peptidivorans TaxID=426128 RepID=A0A1I0H3V6_9FIRM|nr:ABC transporter substrate-binding protein [Natronincola peptidivorans]SET78198.1 NitT/TauT family transport system substrate-binding protein [Natronincola peptidivorans]